MAYIFGESWDLYAAVSDQYAGFWDSGTPSTSVLAAGRFPGSQCFAYSVAVAYLVKSSGVNDAVHHFTCAFRQVAALSGTTLGTYFQLSDAATNQVCIVFRSDGAILLTSATPAGTVLATYSGAVTVANTWFAFEFEVIISATVGRFRARKNGNTSDDFDSGASLNTRPGANSYANKLTIGMQASVNSQALDDFLWRSDAASVPFVGDIRCYTRMPSTTASAQFTPSPSPSTSVAVVTSQVSDATGTSRYTQFTAAYSGTIATVAIQVNTGFTGNMKCALFADASALPGTTLGTATPLVNPVAGPNTFTFGTPVAVTKGTSYWFAVSHDVTAIVSISTTPTGRSSAAVTYAAFPTSAPATSSNNALAGTVYIMPTNNAEYVNETLQDGTTSYVYDSTVGHADFYNLAALSPQPVSVVAVTTRGFIEKSDAGTRGGAVQIKSGGTTVAAPTVTLGSTFGWAWRTDSTNPAGGAWTAAAVDSCTIGPVVIS